jgi:hypothetical protein
LIYLVYRVNWLRGKAHVDGWQEELTLVKHEMQWTILWFQYQGNLWRKRLERLDGILATGHTSYAKKQQKLWNALRGSYLRDLHYIFYNKFSKTSLPSQY